MKWRYLDIRRPEMLAALHLRHKVAQAMRGALNERGFLEVETPILANSTPEGARDYIVPSRPNRASSTPCPRAPAVQADAHVRGRRALLPDRALLPRRGSARRSPARVPQVDIEMSFVEGDDVCDMMEGVMAETLKAVGVTDVTFPLQKMQYADAMRDYGCDRPDVRFGMLLHDITDIVKDTGFKVFASVAQSGGGEGHQRRRVPATGPAARWRSSPTSRPPMARRAWPGWRSPPMARRRAPSRSSSPTRSGRP